MENRRSANRANLSLISILVLFLSLAPSLFLPFCSAEIISLTDNTFDSVREAFNNPSMLILIHSKNNVKPQHLHVLNKISNLRAIEEFNVLSHDQILQDRDIMLVTLDGHSNRMLAARLGVSMSEFPSLILLYGDRIFRYQGTLTSSALMRSYALHGYQNQGMGEYFPDASWILLTKAIYLNWIYNGGRWDSLERGFNLYALVISGFVFGMMSLGCAALIISFCTKDPDISEQMEQREKQKKMN
mmetsp:Transcript_21668/g.44604  ORF Transcript_21668/g.44604 Transcript_21668/m.44604 type:complete len:244 (-) Transcript_21668:1767-2498(-)